MDLSVFGIILSVIAIVISIVSLLKKNQSLTVPQNENATNSTTTLRLQAYERLVLLTERISLHNLISRLNQPGMSAVEMKMILTENVKQEFEYNSTQQLYVNQPAWDAVRNLKEQNVLIINRVYDTLPLTASAADLNKKILELVLSQPEGAIHDIVLKVLNAEAKKLM